MTYVSFCVFSFSNLSLKIEKYFSKLVCLTSIPFRLAICKNVFLALSILWLFKSHLGDSGTKIKYKINPTDNTEKIKSKVGNTVFLIVWRSQCANFNDFSSFSILREIKFEDSRGAKSAILTHLKGLNFDFYVFLHFLKAEIDQINWIQSP